MNRTFVFNQQVNMGDVIANQKFTHICASHPDCIGCPMANGQIFENLICETESDKGDINK